MSRARRGLLTTGALVLLLGAPGAARAAETCATEEKPGGEWRSFGRDYSNTRTQSDEKVISPGDAPLLSPAWSFSTAHAEAEGDFTSTPVVADGCVYAASNRGWAFALNADTGELVWKARLPYGGGANASVGVAMRRTHKRRRGGKPHMGKKRKSDRAGTAARRRGKRGRWVRKPTVFVAASRTRPAEGCPPGDECVGPYVVALDQATGKVAWATPPIDDQEGSDVYGSPIVFGNTLLLGVSGGSAELGDEADRYAFQGSMNFLNTRNGKVLRKTWTIHPPMQPDDQFAGAGIWSTPAIDPEERVAYAGTANPFKPQAEHEHANAVLKFDIDRRSRKFGQILGSYKGNVDEYVPGLSEAPCYDFPNNHPPYYPQGIGSCGDIDLDFGASANIFTVDGRKLVGAGQKSGVYHVFDAKTMEGVWTQIVGPPGALGGIVGSTAYDGDAVYGPITVPGYAWSLSAAGGGHRWVAPIADGAHWGPPVSVANGGVYSVDLTGYLDVFDARSGALLAKRPLLLGGSSSPTTLSWGGVAIARNTVYAAVGIQSLPEGHIVALRPGGPADLLDDAEQTVGDVIGGGGGGGGGGGASGAIVAGPGAVYTTYATPVMTTQVGGPLSFVNLDLPQHDVVADDKGPDGAPLFQSKLSGIGEIAPVEGLDRVQAGRSYGFFCSLHPGMRGTLIVR